MGKLVGKTNSKAVTSELAGICSATEAAELLGLSTKRVSVFCNEGRLASKRIGRDWAISRSSLEAFAELERRPGNPSDKKTAAKLAATKKLLKKRHARR